MPTEIGEIILHFNIFGKNHNFPIFILRTCSSWYLCNFNMQCVSAKMREFWNSIGRAYWMNCLFMLGILIYELPRVRMEVLRIFFLFWEVRCEDFVNKPPTSQFFFHLFLYLREFWFRKALFCIILHMIE